MLRAGERQGERAKFDPAPHEELGETKQRGI